MELKPRSRNAFPSHGTSRFSAFSSTENAFPFSVLSSLREVGNRIERTSVAVLLLGLLLACLTLLPRLQLLELSTADLAFNASQSSPPAKSAGTGDHPFSPAAGGNEGSEQQARGNSQRESNCWSKDELHHFWKPFKKSEAFSNVLSKYIRQHELCIMDIMNGNTSIMEERSDGCKYVIYNERIAGLGNRLLGMVSAFTYALLTNRTFFIAGGHLRNLLCNPMEPLPWFLHEEKWRVIFDQVLEERKNDDLSGSNAWLHPHNSSVLNLDLTWSTPKNTTTFFCQTTQDLIASKFSIVIYNSGIYYLPAFHFVPSFHDLLQNWVPDGLEFLHIGRFVINPSNKVWMRITHFYDTFMRHQDIRLGVQIRQFGIHDEECVDQRVISCITNKVKAFSSWLPEEQFLKLQTTNLHKEHLIGKSIGILITSLNGSHADAVAEFLKRHMSMKGDTSMVYKISSEGFEKQDLQQYEDALVEMFLLSFSNVLMTTDLSTFGNIASGLYGGETFSLNIVVRLSDDWKKNGRPACEQVSSEPCQHSFPFNRWTCGEENKTLEEFQPFVSTCDAFHYGLQHHQV